MRLQQEANQNKARMSGVNEMEEDEANASHSAGYTRFTPHLYDTSFSARSQSLESSTHHSPASPLEQHVTPPRTQSYPVGVVAEVHLSPHQSPRPFAHPHETYPVDLASPRRQQRFDYYNTYTKQGMLSQAGINFDFTGRSTSHVHACSASTPKERFLLASKHITFHGTRLKLRTGVSLQNRRCRRGKHTTG